MNRSCLIAVAVAVLTLSGGHVQAKSFFENLLPAWPLNNVGEPIGDDIINAYRSKAEFCPGRKGEFVAFPSKPNRDPDEIVDKKTGLKFKELTNYKYDSDYICNDGDQTSYLGLLCASGESSACNSIAAAQDRAGRFYRSPHRRWEWENRCFDKAHPLVNDVAYPYVFIDQCANGFSPDMNLGLLLFTLKTRNVQKYARWLAWVEANGATTQLCDLDRDNKVVPGTCNRVYWPRVCEKDLGYLKPGEKPGYAINGKYGGVCALRPWDALDFAAVNEATGVAMPDRLSNWEVQMRGLIKLSKELLKGAPIAGGIIAPLTEVPPLLLMSSVDSAKWPLHLDAMRVLIRMMIRNPSLQLNNLPDLPNPGDLPGILGLATSNATDPFSIAAAANIIYQRAKWNPFYQLLAEGPTPGVRENIVKRCPTKPDAIDKPNANWLWELSPEVKNGVAQNDKRYSMGWDCVFMANLYNKMRVKKNLVDELLALFLKYGDVLGNSLKQTQQALQLAQAANDLAEKGLQEAQHLLDTAQDFVNEQYASQKKAAEDRVTALKAQLTQLTQQAGDLEKRVNGLKNTAQAMPDTIVEQVTSKVCDKLGPFKQLCKNVTNPVRVANRAKQNILNQATALQNQIITLRTNAVGATQRKLQEAQQEMLNLDTRLQDAQNKLQKKVLQTAVGIARAEFALKAHLLEEARKRVADVQRVNDRVRGYLCVWKKDLKCSSET